MIICEQPFLHCGGTGISRGAMCILVVAIQCHPAVPLIIAHNRDEKRDRPSGDDLLEDTTGIVCGRDLQAGGMVVGLHSTSGRFAALTNCRTHVRRASDPSSAVSRGRLVEYLATHEREAAFQFLETNRKNLDGFHVVFGNIFGAAPHLEYAWSAPDDDGNWFNGGSSMIPNRVVVICNENPALDAAAWPKSEWLKEQVSSFILGLPENPSAEAVQLGISSIMDRYDVPGICPPTGLPTVFTREKELMLHTGPFSPWRKQFPEFGTVSQRILVSHALTKELNYFYRSTNVQAGLSRIDSPPGKNAWHHLLLPWSRDSPPDLSLLENNIPGDVLPSEAEEHRPIKRSPITVLALASVSVCRGCMWSR